LGLDGEQSYKWPYTGFIADITNYATIVGSECQPSVMTPDAALSCITHRSRHGGNQDGSANHGMTKLPILAQPDALAILPACPERMELCPVSYCSVEQHGSMPGKSIFAGSMARPSLAWPSLRSSIPSIGELCRLALSQGSR
jgi:hypothetical protein